MQLSTVIVLFTIRKKKSKIVSATPTYKPLKSIVFISFRLFKQICFNIGYYFYFIINYPFFVPG